jgi:uncharacterized protein YbcI
MALRASRRSAQLHLVGRKQAEMAEDDRRGEELSSAATNPTLQVESSPAGERGVLQGISIAMVQIYKELFGRGPTKVRTNFAGPDVVVCTLEHTFTPAERNLKAMGEQQRLRETRLMFQYAEESRFVLTIEQLTGRRVKAFISGIDTNVDVACELFVLHPDTSMV